MDEKKKAFISNAIIAVIAKNDLTFKEAHSILNELSQKTCIGAFEGKFSGKLLYSVEPNNNPLLSEWICPKV